LLVGVSVHQPDGEDDLKRRQLMELAIINGTYRDTAAAGASTALAAASVLSALPISMSRKSHQTHLIRA